MTDFEGFVTRKEASALLHCSIKTLKRLEALKELKPVFLIERVVGYRQSDLQRMTKQRDSLVNALRAAEALTAKTREPDNQPRTNGGSLGHSCCSRWSDAGLSRRDNCARGVGVCLATRLGVKRFCSLRLRNSLSAKDSAPALQGHPETASPAPRQKPAFAEPVNDNGRRIGIPEEREISQNAQIAPMQIALHPRAR